MPNTRATWNPIQVATSDQLGLQHNHNTHTRLGDEIAPLRHQWWFTFFFFSKDPKRTIFQWRQTCIVVRIYILHPGRQRTLFHVG